MHDEACLIQWNRRGDAEAFRTLIARYGRMVYATALRVLGNPSDAEDVTQDCFEKLARTTRAPRGFLGPWLHRMAVNGALDRVRSETARKRRETTYEQLQRRETEVEWSDLYPLVDEAIDALPEKLRRALVAHFLEGLTHEEVAQRESVSRAAVTQRIHRALDLMRKSLQRKGVAVPAVAVLAGTLGEQLAHAAALPVSLTEKLGRIALAGPVIGTTVLIAGLTLVQKALLTGAVAILVGIAGTALVWMRGLESRPATEDRVRVATDPDASEAPVARQSTEAATSSVNEPSELVQAVAAALGNPNESQAPSVSGRVYDRVTGENVAGAEITCRVGQERYQAKSNENGMYTLSGLAVGDVYITCRKANGYYMGHEQRGSGASPFRRTFKLVAGRHYEGIDFALEKGLSVTGRVVDLDGRPAKDVQVTGYADVNQFWLTNIASTAADGSFEISGFPPTVNLMLWADRGQFLTRSYGPFVLPQGNGPVPELELLPEAIVRGVLVDKAGRTVKGLRVVPQFFPDVSAREIESSSDEEGRFELKGMPPGNALLRVCRDVEIVNMPCPSITLTAGELREDIVLECSIGDQYVAGVVVDERGDPMSAEVRCKAADGTTTSTRANGAGMFMLQGLEPGSYTVTAYDWGRHIPGEPVSAKTGDSSVRVVMLDPFKVSGRVVDAATGEPITDYEIKDAYSLDLLTNDQRYTRRETADGTFDLTVAQTGEVNIAVRAHGYRLAYTPVQLDVGGEDISGLEIKLQPQVDLRGIVRDQQGRPIDGALVFSGPIHRYDADDYASARTGTDGTFVLPAGKLAHDFLTVFHPDYPEARVALTEAYRIGQLIDVKLITGSTLECTVLANGVPCKAYVAATPLTQDGGNPSYKPSQTNTDGTCLIRALAPGEYRVQASLPSVDGRATGAIQETLVTVGEGSSMSLVFNFSTGSGVLSCTFAGVADSLRLKLEIPTGQGLQHYHVFNQQGVGSGSTMEILKLPGGPATLEISWSTEGLGGHTATQEVVLTPDAVTAYNIDLEALASAETPG